jgi:CubicO group peptidase (beta-lactamase class C family)
MTTNGLTDAMVRDRNGMGWGIGNVEVVVDAALQKVPANRGEYGWNGSAGTYFWNDPATEMITILMTQFADRLPGQFRATVQQAVQQ